MVIHMKEKLQWKKLFIIGLAFFSVSIAWSIYNSVVPLFLNKLSGSSLVVGAIMTIDNVFGVIFQPYFGKKSDAKKSKYGRRMPYMMLGIPAAALFMILIPLHTVGGSVTGKIALLMCAVVGMNFFMSYYRAPSIALMPDITPPRLRAKANGVINFMGGIGASAAYFVGGRLLGISDSAPFAFASVLMLLALLALMAFYKEPEVPVSAEENPDEQIGNKGAGLLIGKNGQPPLVRSNPGLILMLLAIFFWFCGYNGVETFFTLFATTALGIEESNATMLLTFMSVSFLIFAIPAGIIGGRLGRKPTILAGIGVMLAAFAFILAFGSASNLRYALIVSGLGWALININSYPTIASMAPAGETGKYTGFYYAFSFSASIVSPILFGGIADLAGMVFGAGEKYAGLFAYGAVMFGLALLMVILTVKKEKGPARA